MSFTNAPVTKCLVIGLVAISILASLLDVKHYFYIVVDTHIWQYGQLWRALVFQLCYANSFEVLFAVMTLYHMRIIERFWGSRKYASFLCTCGLLTSILTPALLTVIIKPLTMGIVNYLPSGPTPLVFAILAQFHAIVPHIYKYRIVTPTLTPTGNDGLNGLTFSDKSYRYLFAIQLALSQWPGSLLGALIGWVTGYLWRNDILPGAITRWRVPRWLVGMRTQKRNDGFEGLRRRMEGENTATASGIQGQAQGEAGRRRTVGQQFLDQFRGAF